MKKLFLIVLILTGISVGIFYRDSINLNIIREFIQSAGWLAPVVFILLYICFTVMMLPGSILTILGGVLFGYWGILVNLVAATLGASAAFIMSKYISQDWVRKHILHDDKSKIKQKLHYLMISVEDNGWQVIALLRLIPIVPFNLLNYILGLTTISLGVYFITSLVFMLPGTIAYTYLGIVGNLALQGDSYSLIKGILLTIGIFAGLFFIIKVISIWRKQDIEKLKLDI